jgi:hypothetical protein
MNKYELKKKTKLSDNYVFWGEVALDEGLTIPEIVQPLMKEAKE